MRSLITGANGLIGSHIVGELLNRGESVRAFVKPETDISTIKPYSRDMEIVCGDIRDRGGVEKAVRGCDEVYHLAGIHLLWEKDKWIFNDVNVVGTENVVEESVKNNLKRIIFTSTCDIVGVNQRARGELGDERDVTEKVEDAFGPYGRSKILSERAVRNFSDEIEVVVVHPSCPIGKNNTLPTEPGRLIESILRENLKGYIERKMNFVHVEDCANGHILAMKNGKKDERYVLAGKNIHIRDFINKVAELGSVRAPRLVVPYGVGIGFAYASEKLGKFNGFVPRVSVEAVRLIKDNFVFNSEKAERELGYKFRGLNETVIDAVEWHLGRIRN